MKKPIILCLLNTLLQIGLNAQTIFPSNSILSNENMEFLSEMTKDVMESSRIYPGQKILEEFGANNTGGILIRPGGRDCYFVFWIRDYAMSLESGFVINQE